MLYLSYRQSNLLFYCILLLIRLKPMSFGTLLQNFMGSAEPHGTHANAATNLDTFTSMPINPKAS